MKCCRCAMYFLLLLSMGVGVCAQSNSDSFLLEVRQHPHEDTLLHNLYQALIKDASINSQYEQVPNYLDSALYYARKTNDDVRIAQTYGYFAIYYRLVGDIDNAKKYNELSIQYLSDNKESPTYALSLFNLGSLAQIEGKYELATKYYFECLGVDERNNNWARVGATYNNLSIIYKETGDSENSIEFLRKANRVFKKQGGHYEKGMANYNLATTYLELDKFDSVIYYGNLVMEHGKKAGNYEFIGTAHQLLSLAYSGKEQYVKGKRHAVIALDTLRNLPLGASKIQSYLALGIAQSFLNEFSKAEENLLTALQLSESAKYAEGKNMTRSFLANHYMRTGNFEKAYHNLKLVKTNSDSVLSVKNKRIINNLNVKYETSKKDAQIKDQELELAKKTNQRNLYLFGLGMLGLVALFIVGRHRYLQKISKEKIARLEQQQKLGAIENVLLGEEKERERIAKELHDGLGGLLATARLQLQQSKKQHQVDVTSSILHAEQIIDDAYEEVRRISHDMMPSALANLGLKSAIEDLADKINVSRKIKVVCQLYMNDLNIKKSTQIALYRIIQESLNNTLKHAQASQSIIQITENKDGIHLTVEDDGLGFDSAFNSAMNGMGMKSIESRVKYLGGTMSLDSRENQGTSLDVFIPKSAV